MAKKLKRKKKGSVILLRRRLYVTLILIVLAGFATAGMFIFAKKAKAGVSFDPYFTLSTGKPKIRIFQPLSNSVGNEGTFTASGVAPPSTTISLKVDGVSKATTTTNSKGNWSTTLSGVSNGNHTLSASTSLSGPFSVIAANSAIAGYSVVDLPTNAMVSAANVGLGTALYSILNQGSGSPAANAAVKVGNDDIYLVRERSVSIFNVPTQTATKTIVMNSQFTTGGDSPVDSGETFKRAVLSADGSRLYLLYSSDTSGKILAIDTATKTLINGAGFPATVVAGATGMVSDTDSSTLYVIAYNSTQLDVINTNDGNVASQILGASARDIAVSPDGSQVFISKAMQDTNYYIALVRTDDGTTEDTAFNLGTAVEGSTLFAPNSTELYVASANDYSLRSYSLTTHNLSNSITLSNYVLPQTRLSAQSTDGSRLYLPLADDTVAVIDSTSLSVIANIAPPASNFKNIHGLLYYNNGIYITYDRAPDPTSLILGGGDYSSLYQSLAIANANTNTNTAASPITVNGVSSGYISQPVSTSPISLTNSAEFSVGDPVTITSPTPGEAVDSANPTIIGTGPKNSTIQLKINSGSAINVAVDSSGNWQKQVTLTKNKTNSVVATYNNKRARLVLPSTFTFGSNIAKNELSVIDTKSGYEQNPITLPAIGLSNVRLNTSSAINTKKNKYYLINVDLTELVNNYLVPLATASPGTTLPTTNDVLTAISTSNLGGIDVYSTQAASPQVESRIMLPNGEVPISIVVSPDGKSGMALAYDIPQQINLLQGQNGTSGRIPIDFVRLNLEDNTVIGDPISFTVTFPDGTQEGNTNFITTLVSAGISLLSKPGSYNKDGSAFYTSGFSIGKVAKINIQTGEKTLIDIPGSGNYRPVSSVVVNPNTNVLYVNYMDIQLDPERGMTGLTPHFAAINLSNNQVVGDSALPNLPLLGTVVNSSGTKAYFLGIDIQAFMNTIAVTNANSQGVLVEALPQFQLGIYDMATGAYQTRDITNTEVPYNMVLSPDDSTLFIPSLFQNIIHTYDTKNDVIDGGNAPIILGGVSTAISTSSNIGEVSLGEYTDTASYYVPADAPVVPPTVVPGTTETNGTTVFKFLPATTTAGNLLASNQLSVPSQAVQVIRDTAEQSISRQRSEAQQITLKTWLVYILYGTFVGVLVVTGFATWKTNMLLGGITEEDYV